MEHDLVTSEGPPARDPEQLADILARHPLEQPELHAIEHTTDDPSENERFAHSAGWETSFRKAELFTARTCRRPPQKGRGSS